MNLSAVVLTKNEEKNIRECLESLNFCDEVIVIDDDSKDRTCQIAKKLGAKIYKRSLDEDFSAQRNFGLEKASGKWVLFVDADERVDKKLKNEIVQIINNPLINYSGFYIKRVDNMWGRKLLHGETGNIRLLRLARRKSGKWRRKVHEVWEITGKTKTLKYPLEHFPHQTLREFIRDVNWMSSLHARANLKEGKKSSLTKIVVFPVAKFISNWVLKRGFLDKEAGLVVALVMSFHSFLSWGKLWILQKRI